MWRAQYCSMMAVFAVGLAPIVLLPAAALASIVVPDPPGWLILLVEVLIIAAMLMLCRKPIRRKCIRDLRQRVERERWAEEDEAWLKEYERGLRSKKRH